MDSVLSYGAEVWGPQLAAKAAASSNHRSGCGAEALHLSFLRQELQCRSVASARRACGTAS